MYLAEPSTISRSTQLAVAGDVVRLRHFQRRAALANSRAVVIEFFKNGSQVI